MTILVIIALVIVFLAILYVYSAKGILSLSKFQQRKQEEEIKRIEPVLDLKKAPVKKPKGTKSSNRKPRRKPKVE